MVEFKRHFHSELLRRLREDLNFMQIILGPRQVGKSTAVLDICKDLGVDRSTYATADIPVPPGQNWIRENWHTARAKGKNNVLVLDEVHKIQGWDSEVKILFDEERRRKDRLKVILLGSASWLLQKGLSDSLAGRFEILRAPHWSYRETKQHFGWNFISYLKFGGYPSPANLITDVHRWQSFILDSIIEPILSRDLLALKDIAKPALFRQTFELILHYPAQEISLQKLLGQLTDSGNSTTIRGYLDLLEAGFVLKNLHKYSTRPISVKASSPKLIQMCPGLFSAFNDPSKIDKDSEWKGRVFEATIGSFLTQNFRDVSYWRDGNFEVDFVVNEGSYLFAIEIKSGTSRSNRGLERFAKQFKKVIPITLNWEAGIKLLESDNPFEFLKSVGAA